MTWPGWADFDPAAIRQATKPKRSKFRAEHVFVTEDLTLFSRADFEALAAVSCLQVPTQVVVATKKHGPVTKARPLADLAEDLGFIGHVFDSGREGRRWCDLKTRERLGLITNLERQVPFELHKEGVVISVYVADFTYHEDGRPVVEDAKGCRTREYLRKRKLFQREYHLAIRET
jgi:hypothetical protein